MQIIFFFLSTYDSLRLNLFDKKINHLLRLSAISNVCIIRLIIVRSNLLLQRFTFFGTRKLIRCQIFFSFFFFDVSYKFPKSYYSEEKRERVPNKILIIEHRLQLESARRKRQEIFKHHHHRPVTIHKSIRNARGVSKEVSIEIGIRCWSLEERLKSNHTVRISISIKDCIHEFVEIPAKADIHSKILN